MIGCCCTPLPCCRDYLFRPPDKGITALNLTMEALHGWYLYDTVMNDYTLPFRTQESLSDPFTIPLAYEAPIPTAFMPAEGFLDSLASPGFYPFDRELGWYVSPSVTFMQIPGDPVYSGTSTPITGRWFFASNCRFGFWFDSDVTLPPLLDPPYPYWTSYVSNALPSPLVLAEFDPDLQVGPMSTTMPRLRIELNTYRGLDLFAADFVTCRPAILFQSRDFWQRRPRTGPDVPIVNNAGDYWGDPAQIRVTEDYIDPPNPMAIDLGGYSAEGSDPQHMIPPPEMEIYRGVRSVMEYFCVQFTVTEAT